MGYAGGTTESPTYRNLGDHSEAIQVDFDPEIVTFEELVQIFWESHDPAATSWSRQYRSVLFYHDEEQRELAEASRRAVAERIGREVSTPIEPVGVFTRAEDYHQKYSLRNSATIYAELRSYYDDDREFVDSTAAARLNGYLGGHGSLEVFQAERDSYGLSQETLDWLEEQVEEIEEGKCEAQ